MTSVFFLKALYSKAPLFWISYNFPCVWILVFLKYCKLNYAIVSITLFDSMKFLRGSEDVAVSSCVRSFWIMNTASAGECGNGNSCVAWGRAVVSASSRRPRGSSAWEACIWIPNPLSAHSWNYEIPGQAGLFHPGPRSGQTRFFTIFRHILELFS